MTCPPYEFGRRVGPRPPRSSLARLQRAPVDMEAEKRHGWCRHGILVVAAEDDRLNWPERELVRQLGEKLYGRRRRGGQDHG